MGDRYILFSGVDDLVLESIILGVSGWVSGLVNAFPRENRLLWDLAAAGRFDEAREVYRWYTPLLHLDTHAQARPSTSSSPPPSAATGPRPSAAPQPERSRGPNASSVLGIIRKAIATRPDAAMDEREPGVMRGALTPDPSPGERGDIATPRHSRDDEKYFSPLPPGEGQGVRGIEAQPVGAGQTSSPLGPSIMAIQQPPITPPSA